MNRKSEYKVGRFSDEDDKIIKEHLAEAGRRQQQPTKLKLFREIAQKLNRKVRAVKDHIENLIYIPSRPWTEEESQLLMRLRNEGLEWVAIAERLGRSDHQVRNRHRVLSNQHHFSNVLSPIRVHEPSDSPAPEFDSFFEETNDKGSSPSKIEALSNKMASTLEDMERDLFPKPSPNTEGAEDNAFF